MEGIFISPSCCDCLHYKEMQAIAAIVLPWFAAQARVKL
jgi:hypothetical protein